MDHKSFVIETLKEVFKPVMLRISGGILNMLERKLFRSQDQPPSCCQQTSSLTSSTVPEGRPDTSVKQARMTQPSSSCSKRRQPNHCKPVTKSRESGTVMILPKQENAVGLNPVLH